jgi:ketol-acid reductoisomerase
MSTPVKGFANVLVVGFGSQGQAWVRLLRASGVDVKVFLSRKGLSFEKAQKEKIPVFSLETIGEHLRGQGPTLIACLCPDSETGPIYEKYLRPLSEESILLVLAHGFAVYSGSLDREKMELRHEVSLLAPKAIGPKLEEKGLASKTHSLVAGVCVPRSLDHLKMFNELSTRLGFAKENLVPATFDQETIGDLISEQGLLCGPVFSFLVWTVQAMRKAQIPERLIYEECFTELELIASLLKDKQGLETFLKISKAAQIGTVKVNQALVEAGMEQRFAQIADEVVSKKFASEFLEGKYNESHSKFVESLRSISP